MPISIKDSIASIKSYRTPFIVFIAFTLLCSLSLWQLSRGLEKKQLLNSLSKKSQAPLLTLLDIPVIAQNPFSYAHRVLQLKGHFRPYCDILLDNKMYKGQVGYEVLTPFILPSNHQLLINRGWIPRGASRHYLPSLPPILTTTLTLKGEIIIPSKNRFIKNHLDTPPFPVRIQEIDLALLKPLLNAPLMPFVLQLDPESPLSFEPPLEKAIWLKPERHFAYALQWLLLAFSLVIIYTRVYYDASYKPKR